MQYISIFPGAELDVWCVAAPVKRFRLCHFIIGQKCSSRGCLGLRSSFLVMQRELRAAMLQGVSRSSAWIVQGRFPGAGVTGMLNPMSAPFCIAECNQGMDGF